MGMWIVHRARLTAVRGEDEGRRWFVTMTEDDEKLVCGAKDMSFAA
jgi:hypothetical protein